MAADDRDMNRDPITDEPGAHPVGTGVGATGGALAGAAAGTFAGPVGTMVGGVIGAVVGGLAGKAAAEAINPTAEEAHWRETYTREPYYEPGRSFDDYGPAYRHGVTARLREDTDWEAAEPRLASEWENQRAGSGLTWEQARPASRAAWERIGGRAGSGAVASDTAMVRASDLAPAPRTAGTDLAGDSMAGSPTATVRDTSVPGFAGTVRSAGTTGGNRSDFVDVLEDLVECCRDGEYGFGESAQQAQRADIRSLLQQRALDCRRAADELNQHIVRLGGSAEDSGSALGAVHRGWVSVKAKLSTHDDKAVLEECERGEDNAVARYRKALQQPLPTDIQAIVERQFRGVQRNHEQVRELRNQLRAEASQDSAARGAMGSSALGGAVASAAPSMPHAQSQSQSQSQSQGMERGTGAAGMVGAAQSAGNTSGDRGDIVDALQDLAECCKDGEYGFRECAEQARRQDLKSLLLQRADDCRRGAEQLNQQIRQLGGSVQDSGSALGALHRGWVSVKTKLSTYDDKAVLEECERGEDNAMARYRKALQKPLPAGVRAVVESQFQAVQRNHDQIRMLRDSTQRS
ncbi:MULTISPECIES: ferritin-like domain-containing protein [Ramlibacter]